MDTAQTTHISLCSGYGGIDLGLRRVIPNLRTVAYAEIEAFACELLLSRMESGSLDAAPIWSNLKSFPWSAFSGRVDILSGGYPCQPFSAAGKRLGAEDERHLWPFIADGIRILRPRVCFFENVEGHISLGLREVIDELGGMGYRATWGIFSAAEVGAPHQRKRVFVMAHRIGEGLDRYISELAHQTGWQEQVRPTAGCNRSGGERGMANTNDGRSGKDWQSSEPRATGLEQSPCTQGRSDEGEAGKEQVWPSRPGDVGDTTGGYGESHGLSLRQGQGQLGGAGRCNGAWPSRPGEPQHWWEPPRVVANTGRDGGERRGAVGEVRAGDARETCEGQGSGCTWAHEAGERSLTESGGIGSEPAVGDPESERPATCGAEHEGQCRKLCTPSAGSEGRVGDTAECKAEPEVGGDADGSAGWMGYAELCVSCDNRTDELRLLGNGVVPATAARAFTVLMEELLA